LAFAKNYGWIDIAPKLAETNVQAPNNAPPLSGSKTIRHEIYPLHYTSKNLTELAIRLHNEGYKMTFDESKEGNAKRLTISLRSLSTDTHPASATFKVDEMIKDADMIVVGANGEMPFVRSEKITFAKPRHLKDVSQGDAVSKENARKIVKEQIDSITKSKVKKVNKQIDSAIKGEVKKTIKSQTDQQKISNAPPPPSGSYSGFNTLYTYLEKHIRYPAKYFENRIVDNVIAEFIVAADHKISSCKIKNDAKPLFAEEVSRQLKSYTDTVNRAPGTYFFVIQFNLVNTKAHRTWAPSNEYLNLTGKPDCAGNIELTGYVKEE
jgi:hypothetical protein